MIADESRATTSRMSKENPDPRAKQFRAIIMRLLENSGLSMSEASVKAGLDKSYISQTLRQARFPTEDTREALAVAFGVDPSTLRADSPVPPRTENAKPVRLSPGRRPGHRKRQPERRRSLLTRNMREAAATTLRFQGENEPDPMLLARLVEHALGFLFLARPPRSTRRLSDGQSR